MDISKVIPWVILALAVIAAAVAFVVTLIQASPARRREILNSVLMSLAVEAERLYGAKTGQLEEAAGHCVALRAVQMADMADLRGVVVAAD